MNDRIRQMKHEWKGNVFYVSFFDTLTGNIMRGVWDQGLDPIIDPKDQGTVYKYNDYRSPYKEFDEKYCDARRYADKCFSPVPETIDVKITEICDVGCKECYMDSTAKGIHCDISLIEKLIDGFDTPPYQIALGGGEPTYHPEFINILELIRSKGVIPNYTTSGKFLDKFANNSNNIINDIIDASVEYCGGVSLSYHPHLGSKWFKTTYNTLYRKGLGGKLNIQVIVDNNIVQTLSTLQEMFKVARINLILLFYYPDVGRSNIKGLMDKQTYMVDLPNKLKEIISTSYWSIAFSEGLIPYFLSRDILPTSFVRSSEGLYSCYVDNYGRMSKSSFNPPWPYSPTIFETSSQDLWNKLGDSYWSRYHGVNCDGCKYQSICTPVNNHSYYICNYAEHNK